jgi:hypothetical protein
MEELERFPRDADIRSSNSGYQCNRYSSHQPRTHYQPTSLLPPDSRYDSERARPTGQTRPSVMQTPFKVSRYRSTHFVSSIRHEHQRPCQSDGREYTPLRIERSPASGGASRRRPDISDHIGHSDVHRVRIRANQDHWSGVHRRYPYRASGSGVVRSASMPRSWNQDKSATLLAPENLTVNIIV